MQMRDEAEVQLMLKRVDDLLEIEANEDDHELMVLRDVLLWVCDRNMPEHHVTDFFPEED